MIKAPDVVYRVPLYQHHWQPTGHMPRIVESAALWQFLIMATQILDKIPQQATLEGNVDRTANLRQIAESVSKMYDVTEEAMFHAALIDAAKREAARCEMYWNPRLDAWFASGGKSYNIVTREPEALNKS